MTTQEVNEAKFRAMFLRASPKQCRLKHCEYNRINPIDFSQECIGCGNNRYKGENYVKKIPRGKKQ